MSRKSWVIKKYRALFGRPGFNTRQTRIFLMTTTPKPIFHRIWVRNGRSVKQTTEYHLFSRLSIRDAFMSPVRCWRFRQSGNREAGCGHCASACSLAGNFGNIPLRQLSVQLQSQARLSCLSEGTWVLSADVKWLVSRWRSGALRSLLHTPATLSVVTS